MTEALFVKMGKTPSLATKYLDHAQYSEEGITAYEFMFGKNFVSSGGLETTKIIIGNLQKLNENSKVLDIGSGLGGSSLYINEKYGCSVHGVDISENMIRIAKSRNIENEKIQFEMCDILEKDFPENSFDLIYSRDTILHLQLEDKQILFDKCRRWLKPQGVLVITDYCANKPEFWDDAFKAYVADRKYTLITIEQYKNLLTQSQLKEVKTENITELWIKTLTTELKNLEDNKEKFLEKFSEKQYNVMHSGWTRKINDAKRNLHMWSYFEYTKC